MSTDEDECQGDGSGHNCDINAVCTNTEGGFTCECKEGWSGDGVSCTGIVFVTTTITVRFVKSI